MNKLIIAGGRNYILHRHDIRLLDLILEKHNIVEVVSGGCSGADLCGERWAEENYIKIKRFPADWDKYGKAAGPIRNREMAEYADIVALFPGGNGTESMKLEARKAGIKIYDFRGYK